MVGVSGSRVRVRARSCAVVIGAGRVSGGGQRRLVRCRGSGVGQIVVARGDDAITVKLLKIGKDRIRLLPRNPDYAPIEVQPGQDFAIEGLYCGLVRPTA